MLYIVRIVKESESISHSVMSLYSPMDYSQQGSPVHGILQARRLAWVAGPFSRGSSQPGVKPGSPALHAYSLPSEPPGKQYYFRRFLLHYFAYIYLCMPLI